MSNKSLRQRYIEDMELKGFAERTRKSYLDHIIRYSKSYMKSPDELNDEDIKSYLHSLVEAKKSKSYINQAYSALRFLYETTLKCDWESFKIPRSKCKKRLPVPLTRYEMSKLFSSVEDIKYKAIFELMYCGGLRVSEVVTLRASDINSRDMNIFVQQGKGSKERYTLLSKKALETLKTYYKAHRYLKNTKWLFPGGNLDAPLTPRSVQKKFEELRESLCLNPRSTTHSIRHGFATHSLEAGIDIYHLQKLMGHSNIKTTTRYIHISNVNAVKVTSPHDTLEEDKLCLS